MAVEHLERMGARIKERRKELGLTREDVARRMPGKTSGNQIYRWEKGLHRPSPESLEALAIILECTPAYFLTSGPIGETGDLMTALSPNGNGRDDAIAGIQTALQHLTEQVAELLRRLPDEAPPPRRRR